MPQLSLHLDDAAMEGLRASAQRENLSLSSYARKCIVNNAQPVWPTRFWSTYGAITDPTFCEPDELDLSLEPPRGRLLASGRIVGRVR